MTTRTLLLGITLLSSNSLVFGQSLDQAEVRIPYSELKQLLTRAEPAAIPTAPALLSTRLKIQIERDQPIIVATFRTASFSNDTQLIPLISGDFSLEKQDPIDAAVIGKNNALNLVTADTGVRTIELRLLPILSDGSFRIVIPACPSAILETGNLPSDRALVIHTENKDEPLAANQIRPLSHNGSSLKFRLLDDQQTEDALRPPEPSSWTWQNQALVMPVDGMLTYKILARASATAGSGVQAELPLPPDARDIEVTGEDLVSQVKTRGQNRSLELSLNWKTPGILDRQCWISYNMPLQPLTQTWQLQAPGGEGTLTRFVIPTSPMLAYTAKGLSDPLSPQGLPAALAEFLLGNTCRYLEAATNAELTVTQVPVAAIAEGVVTAATWNLKIEPDGAMLASGNHTIEHKGLLDFAFDTPEGMKLLTCELNGKPVSPLDSGEGKLKLTLPANHKNSQLSCAFTGRIPPLDPVEGTMKLSLPKLPLFIHSLQWQLDLPSDYQAETQGNLTRTKTTGSENPARITLQKNLCRDERPEIHLFYQRTNLNR